MMDIRDQNLSDSMEMYLVTIARLRRGDKPVPLSQLAEALNVTPVSVNEMCRKLQDNGLLVYRPYKGALLTESGETWADHTLRHHRLWEVFLVENLHFSKTQADEIACLLEHVNTDELIDRLDAYLSFPAVSPRGLPIPRPVREDSEARKGIPLTDLTAGKSCQILRFNGSDSAKQFLQEHGIFPGVKVTVIAVSPDDLLVEVDGIHVSLAGSLARAVDVEPLSSPRDGTEKAELSTQNHERGSMEHKEQTGQTALKQIPLSELKKGVEAVVVGVGGKGAVKRRMMDMGVVPGASIKVLRVAPFGDPVEYEVKGYSLSLRKSEAGQIMVEIQSEEHHA